MNRIPDDAFEYYVGLGPERSYQAVAEHYGVAKRSITKRANRDRWQERLVAIERKAREKTETRLVDAVADMRDRHLKCSRAIQRKALETLQTLPLDTAMNAVRALDIALKHERTVLGEPSDRSAVSVEETIKTEYARWMQPGQKGDDDADDAV